MKKEENFFCHQFGMTKSEIEEELKKKNQNTGYKYSCYGYCDICNHADKISYVD